MLIDNLAKHAKENNINIYEICQYHNGCYTRQIIHKANIRNNVYSVAKSVLSLITGILIEKEYLSISDTVASLFPDSLTSKNGTMWKSVQLNHLLTHTTGFDRSFLDIDQTDVQCFPNDFLSSAFDVPLRYPPGEKMIYSDANYYIISRILSKITDCTVHSIAQKYLFGPMDIIGPAWATCPHGFSMGATGLYLTTTDMLKLGVLLLKNGCWNGTQLIPARWINEILKERVRCDSSTFYGYGFWGATDSPSYWARGMLGQIIYVSPENQSVIAWQGCSDSPDDNTLFELLKNLQ